MNAARATMLMLGCLACTEVVPGAELPVLTATADETLMPFDIPAQPLSEALRQYARVSHWPALARSELVAGRTSSSVRGTYSAPEALRLLLAGTGLEMEPIPDQAGGFILRPGAGAAAGSSPHAADLAPELAGYPALVQARIWDTLCSHPLTAPGTYRLLLRLQVDDLGQVQRVRLLDTTGDPARDAAIQAALQSVRLDRPPPVGLSQPLTLFIEPHAQVGGPRCTPGRS